MNKRIAIVAATQGELQPFLDYLSKEATQHSFQSFQLHQLQIDLLYSGIGIMQATYSLMDYLNHRHPDGWIQAGIGGAFDHDLSLTSVYQISSETIIGLGAQHQDGRIEDPFQLGWIDPDTFPYERGVLPCPYQPKWEIPQATGMTSFFSHGSRDAIALLDHARTGQIESMEGAPFFYISLMKKIPFLGIRTISNYVEPRNRDNWQIAPAIKALADALMNWLHDSEYNVDKLFGIGNKN